jgi:hypothetical protein
MPELAKDSIALFGYLQPSQFERVIQALIFTFLVHALLPLVQAALQFLGERFWSLRPWDDAARDLTKLILALCFGGLLAFYTNTDSLHQWLRAKGLTTRTSFPSEWFGVLSKTVTYVILHLNDDRRLYGWPKEWPNESDKGHFLILEPSWINEDGTQLELPGVHGLLIAAKDVKWVEFIGKPQQEQESA